MSRFGFSLVVSLVLIAGEPVVGQALPDELKASFGHGVADRMHVPGLAAGDEAWVDLRFRNMHSSEVTFRWHYAAAGATPGAESVSETTSYRPTAVCKVAGTGRTLFVAGWAERTGTCIVEEWTFAGPPALGTAPPREGTTPETTFTVPVIEKTLLLASQDRGPISDIAFNAYSGQLWMLIEEPGSTRIDGLDTTTLVVQTLFSSTDPGLPSLHQHHSLQLALGNEHGLLAWSQKRRAWESGVDFGEPYIILVFRDSEPDGIIDSVEEMTYGAFSASYASFGFDGKYGVP